MAESTTPVETHARSQTVLEALDANNATDATQTRDFPMEADTSRRDHCDHPNNFHGTLESELLRKTELVERLERIVIHQKEVIATLRSLAQDLEQQVTTERDQMRDLNEEYEQQREHSADLYQSLLREHETVMSLRNQMTESEKSTAAFTEELHEKSAIIKNLETQVSHARAIVNEIESRMRHASHGAPSQGPETCVKEGFSQSQQPENHESHAASSYRASQTSQNIPNAASEQPVRSVPEPFASGDSADDPANDSALTILISYIPTWVRSCFKPADPREADSRKNQCNPKPSSPEIKAKAKRQTVDPKAARTREYAATCRFYDETAEQGITSAEFLDLRKKYEREEQRWFGKPQPMTRAKVDGEAGTHRNDEGRL